MKNKEIESYIKNRNKLKKNYVYRDEFEHDNCGVGLVASIKGEPRRDIVEKGVEALKAVFHRGAVDADGKTGDGAGIMLDVSKSFFSKPSPCVKRIFWLLNVNSKSFL